MINADKVRDLRLMQFTSLLRTYDVVSNARVEQCCDFWLDYEEKYPLINSYGKTYHIKTGKVVDLKNMNEYVKNLKIKLCCDLLEGVDDSVKV